MRLGEADTRAKLIDPAIHARGWTEDLIRREETAGAIEIAEGRPRKQAKGRVDYLLRVKVNPDTQPVAVALIEAKAEDLPPTHGLEQAKAYAACKRLNIPFAFSSNGHLFVEYSRITGKTSRPLSMTEFPTPAELRARYEAAVGFSLTDPAARPLLARYPGGEATRRYYQDAAIRAVLETLARCEKTGGPKRALLALATGSGKTFIAVHLLKRIADAGQLRRALFVCDRDELRLQGLAAFQNVFGADAAEVYRKADGTNNARNARIHIATYQTLNIDTDDADANFLRTYYPENYFSHIVIDECHRSAWGKWSQVLKRNADAVQIGLTAANHPVVIGLGIVASFITVAMALEQSRVLRSVLEYLRVRPHMLRLIFDLCLIALLTIGVLRVVSFGTPASPPELEDKITSWAYRNLGWTVRHLDDPDAFFRLEVRVTSDTDPIPFYIVLHKKYPDTIFVTSTTVVPFGPLWKGMAEKDRRYFIAGLRERLLLLGVQYTGLDSDAKDSLRIDFTNTLAGSRLLTMEEFHRAVGAVQRATKLVTNAVERESWRLGFFDNR